MPGTPSALFLLRTPSGCKYIDSIKSVLCLPASGPICRALIARETVKREQLSANVEARTHKARTLLLRVSPSRAFRGDVSVGWFIFFAAA